MSATSTLPPPPPPPPPPPGRRATEPPARPTSAAQWVAAAGAFLLVAAAAVFVAVNWSALTPTGRSVIVAGVTAGFLAGGATMRRSRPRTGTVVFHLGAALLPVDVAAFALRSGTPIPDLLVVEGVLVAVAGPLLGLVVRSRVLRWAPAVGVPLLATGLGTIGGPAAPITVVAAALVALVLARMTAARAHVPEELAVAIAAIAAAGPLVGAALRLPLWRWTSILPAAGWTGTGWQVPVIVAAVAAALVAVRAHARDSQPLALVALVLAAAGPLDSLVIGDLPRQALLLLPAVTFLGVELAAAAAVTSRLWRRPVTVLALVAELGVLVPTFAGALRTSSGSGAAGGDPVLAAALGVTALAWLVAVARPVPASATGGDLTRLRQALVLVPAAVAAAGAVHAQTGEAALAATAILVLAFVGALLPAGASGHTVTGLLGLASVVIAAGDATVVVLGVGAVAAATVRLRHRPTDAADAGALVADGALVASGLGGLAIAAFGAAGSVVARTGTVEAGTLAVVVAIAFAAALEARSAAADAPRVALLATIPAVLDGPSADAVVPLSLAAVLLVGEAVRLARPWLVPVAVALAAAGLAAAGAALGLAAPVIGTALLVAGGLVLAGGEATRPSRWRVPARVAASVIGVVGLAHLAQEPEAAALTVTAIGGLVAVTGALVGRRAVLHGGLALATLGWWSWLTLHGVPVTEPYLAPVALQLLVWGEDAVREGTSSWLTHLPPVALVAVPGLAARVDGGPGWHALVAGGLATAAVALGGTRRLAGPLVGGTALLVATVVHEALAVVAAVPTWAWLALGGSVLLGTGIALERTEDGPAALGRRAADRFGERFR